MVTVIVVVLIIIVVIAIASTLFQNLWPFLIILAIYALFFKIIGFAVKKIKALSYEHQRGGSRSGNGGYINMAHNCLKKLGGFKDYKYIEDEKAWVYLDEHTGKYYYLSGRSQVPKVYDRYQGCWKPPQEYFDYKEYFYLATLPPSKKEVKLENKRYKKEKSIRNFKRFCYLVLILISVAAIVGLTIFLVTGFASFG